MKSFDQHRTKNSPANRSIIECPKEEVEKINRARQECKNEATSKYVNVNGKIYLVTAHGVMSYEGTGTVAYSQSQECKDISPPELVPSFLVISYDNLPHSQDAISHQIITQLQELGLKNVAVCEAGRLKPELSAQLSQVDYAIFLHSCWMKKPEVKVTNLDACGLETSGSSIPGCGHVWDPCSLLALTNSVYGRYPKSWLIKVAAQNKPIEHLSTRSLENIQNAVEQIELLIQKTWRINEAKTVAHSR